MAKRKEAASAMAKETTRTVFSLNFSISTPAGIDITPYAIKKEKGRNPARPKLSLKSSKMFGTSGPRMFVNNEITKKIRKTSPTTA
jgi:hypothetical protein